MADEDELGAAKRRRPPTTIDLKATEVASESVDPPESAESAATEPPPATEAAPETPGIGAKPGANRRTWSGTSALNDRIAAMRARVTDRLNVRIIAAGAIGAAAMLVLFVALWLSGVFPVRDDRAVLNARLALLETQVRDLAARPQPAGLDQRAFADLAARVGVAEQAMGRLSGLDARVAALETAVRPIADLRRDIDAANAGARDARSRADAAFEAAQKNAETPASAPGVAPAALEALSARVTALEQAEKTAEQKIAVSVGADRAGRLAFVAVALRSAVERGEPFVSEFAAVKPLAPDPATLNALEPFAASGVPRPVMLARELSQLTMPMINAAGTAPRDSGILDRLQQNAERLVRIRPINEAPGDDPTTVVARAEVKATHGDLTGALAELAHLPDAARAPAQGWIKKAEAQVAAVTAARSLADNAIAALGKAVP